MSINWGSYDVLNVEFLQPLAEYSRREARQLYRELMVLKESRIEGLRQLLSVNGILLDTSDDALDALTEWFVENTEAASTEPALPSYRWKSVSWDVGLFLGDCMIERFPHLRWDFETTGGKRYYAFQSPVIFGFSSGGRLDPGFAVLQRTNGYAVSILDYRAGGFPQGVVTVRGISIDIDDLLSKIETPPLNRREFLTWMQIAAWMSDLPADHPELLP